MVNFINVFTCSFYVRRSQKYKKLLELIVFFELLGFACIKAARKMLVKLAPVVNATNMLVAALRLFKAPLTPVYLHRFFAYSME